MVNRVPKTIKVWYLFFYVNMNKMEKDRHGQRDR